LMSASYSERSSPVKVSSLARSANESIRSRTGARDLEVDNAARRLRIETTAQRIQHRVKTCCTHVAKLTWAGVHFGRRLGYDWSKFSFWWLYMRLSILPVAVCCAASLAFGATPMQTGKASLKSAGALAVGPDGILFVGDSVGAAIYALDVNDTATAKASGPI